MEIKLATAYISASCLETLILTKSIGQYFTWNPSECTEEYVAYWILTYFVTSLWWSDLHVEYLGLFNSLGSKLDFLKIISNKSRCGRVYFLFNFSQFVFICLFIVVYYKTSLFTNSLVIYHVLQIKLHWI